MLERILDGYRLRRTIQDDFTLIDTTGELVQAKAVAAEVLFEGRQIKLPQEISRDVARLEIPTYT